MPSSVRVLLSQKCTLFLAILCTSFAPPSPSDVVSVPFATKQVSDGGRGQWSNSSGGKEGRKEGRKERMMESVTPQGLPDVLVPW